VTFNDSTHIDVIFKGNWQAHYSYLLYSELESMAKKLNKYLKQLKCQKSMREYLDMINRKSNNSKSIFLVTTLLYNYRSVEMKRITCTSVVV